MSMLPENAASYRALAHFTHLVHTATAILTPVRTGFSGADVWRVDADGGSWGLRRWPPGAIEPARLEELHRWVRVLSDSDGLPLAIPATSDSGSTWIVWDHCPWQLEPWLPGDAELSSDPPTARVAAAAAALARLHLGSAHYRCSTGGEPWFRVGAGASPAVEERLELLARMLDETRSLALPTSVPPAARRGLELVRRWGALIGHELAAARSIRVPLFPCLRDARPDHFLFAGDAVTGMIDPAAARTESAAADLSRLLGGYLGNRSERWPVALAAYESLRPLTPGERQLIPILDRSNVVLSTWTWIARTAAGKRDDPDGRVSARLATLVERLSAMPLEK